MQAREEAIHFSPCRSLGQQPGDPIHKIIPHPHGSQDLLEEPPMDCVIRLGNIKEYHKCLLSPFSQEMWQELEHHDVIPNVSIRQEC
jgi:hypothetical protein